MKIIGISFVLISVTSIGFRFAGAVKRRCEVLGQLTVALRILRSELLTHGTPLPEAFGMLAAATHGSTADFFASAAKTMARNHWVSPAESLRMAEINLTELTVEDPVRKILRDFSAGLGRFDLDSQLQSIDSTLSRLELVYQTAEQDKSIRCRTYRTLGLCAGLALTILLV